MFFREVKIPEGVGIRVDGNRVIVKGPRGELSKEFCYPRISIKMEGESIKIESESGRRKQNALLGTIQAHIKNMIAGTRDGFTYKMKVCYSHFPIQVEVKKDEVIISNFLGEKQPRKAKIVGDTKVEIKGDTLLIKGIDVEKVGQTAANIEQATRIKGYDPRVFQDGIYIISKKEAGVA